jgi:putative transposase
MTEYSTVRRTYKYRLYHCKKRDGHLHQQINVAGLIWNHALALHKRYYRLTQKYIPLNTLKAHVAHLRMKTARFTFWQALGSQAVQDVLERLDNAYQRFFDSIAKRPPKFRKVKRYTSFTLKQAGWKLLDNGGKRYGKIQLGDHVYKYVKHRAMGGIIKTVTIKRDALGRLWLCFSVMEKILDPIKVTPRHGAGFDFGLKAFLTDHMGKTYLSPLFYKAELKRIRLLSSRKDKKPPDSNNRYKAARLLTRRHIWIADKRRDFHYQLAHELCDAFDVLVFKDLNLDAMKRLWGRKVSDLGFGQFLKIMEYVAWKRGKTVVYISRWKRTTGKCSGCGHEQPMELRERTFHCNVCGLERDRDHNAAINILHAGTSAYCLGATYGCLQSSLWLDPWRGLGVVRPSSDGGPV